LGDATEAECGYDLHFGVVVSVSARMRRKGCEMDCVFHLTSHGWREDPCAENERLETWKLKTEDHESSRITRCWCIWRAGSLDMETRRLLHRRFGSPPITRVLDEAELAILEE
jgi:hypothetical protein